MSCSHIFRDRHPDVIVFADGDDVAGHDPLHLDCPGLPIDTLDRVLEPVPHYAQEPQKRDRHRLLFRGEVGLSHNPREPPVRPNDRHTADVAFQHEPGDLPEGGVLVHGHNRRGHHVSYFMACLRSRCMGAVGALPPGAHPMYAFSTYCCIILWVLKNDPLRLMQCSMMSMNRSRSL